MDKVKKDTGILWICHHCGTINLESLEWLYEYPFEIECIYCKNIISLCNE